MADYEIHFDASKVKAALAKLSPEQVSRRVRAAMDESLSYLQTEVRNRTPTGATGLLRQSIATYPPAISLEGKVASVLDYALRVEEGSPPGEMPSVGKFGDNTPLRLWVRRVLGQERLTFVIARSIFRKGTAGVHMFRDAAQKGRAVVLRIFENHFRL